MVWLVLVCIILNPYTIYGRPGIVVALLFAFYGMLNGLPRAFWGQVILPVVLLIAISIIGVGSSIAHDIYQLNHLEVVTSLLVLCICTKGLHDFCVDNSIDINTFLLIVLSVCVFNSLVVLAELNFDGFRLAKEALLNPLLRGSIDYSEGYRMRGIAAAGGANLSLLIPCAIVVALHLYDRHVISIYALGLCVLILVMSVLVIGRTGVALLPLPFAIFLMLSKRKTTVGGVIQFLAGFALIATLAVTLFSGLTGLLADKYSDAFLKYSFQFLLEGREGIQDEGTVEMIIDFLQVLPTTFPETIVGFGFYGGSDFFPWTDSGYARMFLSVGYPLAFLSYYCIYRLYFSVMYFDRFLVLTLITLLAIAEAKEPLLFSGHGARVYLLALVFIFLDHQKSLARNHKAAR